MFARRYQKVQGIDFLFVTSSKSDDLLSFVEWFKMFWIGHALIRLVWWDTSCAEYLHSFVFFFPFLIVVVQCVTWFDSGSARVPEGGVYVVKILLSLHIEVVNLASVVLSYCRFDSSPPQVDFKKFLINSLNRALLTWRMLHIEQNFFDFDFDVKMLLNFFKTLTLHDPFINSSSFSSSFSLPPPLLLSLSSLHPLSQYLLFILILLSLFILLLLLFLFFSIPSSSFSSFSFSPPHFFSFPHLLLFHILP